MLVYQYVSARSNSWQLHKTKCHEALSKDGVLCFYGSWAILDHKDFQGFYRVFRGYSRPTTALTLTFRLELALGRSTMATKKAPVISFHFVTLFEEAFSSYVQASIIGRGIEEGHIKAYFYNPRDQVKPKGAQRFKEKPLRMVDDRPYGGGPGMVMKAEPVVRAIEKAQQKISKNKKAKTLIIFLSPGGEQFTTESAAEIAKKYTDVVVICGRYEGIDARIKKIFKMKDFSVGPWVVTGGELPALVMMDVIARQVPGVLGNFDSREESRVSSHDVYTRPEVLEWKGKKYKVPKVLLSGDHKKIDEWRMGGK